MSDFFGDLGDDSFAEFFRTSPIVRRAMLQMRYIAEGGRLYRRKPAEPDFSEWLAKQEAKDRNESRIAKLDALAKDRSITKQERSTARRMAKKLRAAQTGIEARS
jgi:hypothetical protein